MLADPSPGMQSWVRGVLSPAQVVTLEASWEVLERLADGERFDVIVANRWLPGMPGPQLLAALRTAGVLTPFVLLAPLCRERIRATVRRAGAAVLVEDAFDATAL